MRSPSSQPPQPAQPVARSTQRCAAAFPAPSCHTVPESSAWCTWSRTRIRMGVISYAIEISLLTNCKYYEKSTILVDGNTH
jgi:hypothetical protein